jgi:RNA polymerase sigma factor (sigma-70 family)
MDETRWLAQQFEAHRAHLRSVAFRMLGSLNDADDAVQESWLRLERSDTNRVENLGGWLTTVVARVCLDVLRSRKLRREAPQRAHDSDQTAGPQGADPEQELLLANSVGLALMVVLGTLAPAERLVFVLHDMFAVPFEEIGPIVGRSPTAARQLASRARRRMQGPARPRNVDMAHQRAVVEAFLSASRAGDFEGLLAVLDPDVVHRIDAAAAPAGAPMEVRGARAVARGALAGSRRARSAPAALALVNGEVGVVVAPRGRLFRVATFKVLRGKIVEINVIADPSRLGQLRLAVLAN